MITKEICENQLDQCHLCSISEIAYQKPFVGGNSIYRARTMLGLRIDDRIREISNKSLNEVEEFSNEKSYKVFPNPAKEEINIHYNGKEATEGVFELYDLIGNLKLSVNLKGKNNPVKVSVYSFESGIYFYKITNNNQILLKDKLVIIK